MPVPRGEVATTPADAKAAAARLGGRVVVKAQVHAGGRGKAGGIKVADDADGAERAARQILGMRLKSPQTPPGGIEVRSVLVEEASRRRARALSLDHARPRPRDPRGHGVGSRRHGHRGGRRAHARQDHPAVGASSARHPGFSGAPAGVRPGAHGRPVQAGGGPDPRPLRALPGPRRLAGRDQSAGRHAGRPGPRARRQAQLRRQRALAATRRSSRRATSTRRIRSTSRRRSTT